MNNNISRESLVNLYELDVGYSVEHNSLVLRTLEDGHLALSWMYDGIIEKEILFETIESGVDAFLLEIKGQ